MEHLRRVTFHLVGAAALILAGSSAATAQTPSNMRVDGVVNNRHVLTPTPQFCWDFTGSQTNWQVQVDDDPNFKTTAVQCPGGTTGCGTGSNEPACCQVWFWDSGAQDKGTSKASKCVVLRSITKPGFIPLSADRRANSIYWRLRVQVNGSNWGPWVPSQFRMNQIPLMPENVTVLADPLSSSDPVEPVPAKLAGKTYYVSPSGSDSSAGTQSAPFKTLARAMKALVKGDTLLVRGGVYNENVAATLADGYVSGEPNNPIIVRAYPGETPVLRALSTGTREALRIGGISDWEFDGLTIGGSSAAYGMYLSSANKITVRNCRWESTLTTSTVGMFIGNSSTDVLVTGCKFDQPVFDQIELGGGKNLEIRNNEFTNFNSRHCIHAHGGSGMNFIVADNYFHDGHPYEGVLFLYLGTQGSHVVNNVFANVWAKDPNNSSSASGLANALLVVRSGQITAENNVFYNLENAAIQLNEFSSFGTYRNNIFVKCSSGIRFRGGVAVGSSTNGAVADYNTFYLNTEDLVYAAAELSRFDHPPAGNCHGGPPPSDPSCDPRFINAAAGDFRLQQGSPAIDAGDPLTPVPEGGGTRRDIGRFEVGATSPPYQYQSRFAIQDSTPRFIWNMVDVDNKLELLFDDLPPGDVDYQTKYQLQIDTKPTFDSRGAGRPLLDSGWVSSLVEGFTVPDTRSLAAGEYYVRLRQWDDHEPFFRSPWSDHNLRFRVSGEPQPPYLTGQLPAAGAAGVNESTSITVHVKDDGVGVNSATIKMYVNSALVTPVISGNLNDYTLTYTRPSPFVAGSTVTVRIVAQDLNQSPPGLDTTYSFMIRDTTPPLPPTNVRIL